MKAYIVLSIAVLLIAATAVSSNSMSVYAQGGANMTGGGGANMTGEDVSKLAPDGSATGLVAQGEKFFVVVCPQEFQIIKQCQILVGTPTVVATK